MRIALLGATGKTGRLLLDEALAAGHEMSVLARQPGALDPRPGLRVTQGDARDPAAVRAALAGADAAVSLLGSFNRRPNTETSDATRTLCAAMAEAGPRRLICVTTIGVGDSFAAMRSPLFKLLIRTVLRHIWRDRERQEQVIRASGLDWTLVRPGGLRDGPAAGGARLTGSAGPLPRKPALTRADLAGVLLRLLEDEAATHLRATYCVVS